MTPPVQPDRYRAETRRKHSIANHSHMPYRGAIVAIPTPVPNRTRGARGTAGHVITRAWRGLSGPERMRTGGMSLSILLLHLLGWGMLALAVGHHYRISTTDVFGFGTGVLAYTFGMRHAFDADHIAAIDNTTRKLVSEGKRPLSVGFFFSLGHSTIVFALAVALNFGIRAIGGQVGNPSSGLHHAAYVVGTTVSGSFLYLIGLLNLIALVGIAKVYRSARRGHHDDDELERHLNNRGFLGRLLGGLSRRVDVPWKMYPIGLLFGLGFDTASEVSLLVLSGTAVAGGLPFYAVLSLPILFAAGMTLFDTADGWFMNFAYDWAFSNPVRKVFYNLTIELLGLLGQEANLGGPFFKFFESINLNSAGFVIVGIFAVTWAIAFAYWRRSGVEERGDVPPEGALP
jgi:high-affinity nickel-transport protein